MLKITKNVAKPEANLAVTQYLHPGGEGVLMTPISQVQRAESSRQPKFIKEKSGSPGVEPALFCFQTQVSRARCRHFRAMGGRASHGDTAGKQNLYIRFKWNKLNLITNIQMAVVLSIIYK